MDSNKSLAEDGGEVKFVACCSCGNGCPKVKYYKDNSAETQVCITDDFGKEIRMSVEQFKMIQNNPIF